MRRTATLSTGLGIGPASLGDAYGAPRRLSDDAERRPGQSQFLRPLDEHRGSDGYVDDRVLYLDDEEDVRLAHRVSRFLVEVNRWIGNGVLDNSLEDESLLCEFVGAPVSEGGVESLVVGPPHIVVGVGA